MQYLEHYLGLCETFYCLLMNTSIYVVILASTLVYKA